MTEIYVVSANESFAAQACAAARARFRCGESQSQRQRHRRINTVKAVYELKRTGRYALVTMCIAGGQGIAAIFERAWHAGAMRPATGQLVAHQPCSLFLSE
jgi:acetyl-CoA C-acetyltransferase